MGGRSRVAAQILAGKGFDNVINLSGGIKAWNGDTAIGDVSLGLDLFTGEEAPEETLVVAYSMEQGLRDFYLLMVNKVKNEEARDLFKKMADIEIKHQNRIFREYLNVTDTDVDRETFEQNTLSHAIEGGLTTDEYIDRLKPDLESVSDIISMAMSIEAQALDLYQRAADNSKDSDSRKALLQIANEEQSHLAQLGKLMDTL